MRGLVILLLGIAGLVACDRQPRVNPPTEPAAAAQSSRASGAEARRADSPPVSFVGRWAAEADWCFNPRGDRMPIEITTTELRGYENRCEIQRITELSDGYEAALKCDAEGEARYERVRMTATAQTLAITWMDRSDRPVRLVRCMAPTG